MSVGSLKSLLIKRASLLKNADAKVDLAVDVVTKNFKKDDKWIVYCDNKSQLNEVKEKLNAIDTKNNYYERLKNIELEIDNISNVYNNLNIYTNLLIDKVIVTKLETRYKMNLEIYFNDGSIRNIYYEN